MKALIINWIKRKFNLYSEQDFENATAQIANAKDREDFEWKLKTKLFKK